MRNNMVTVIGTLFLSVVSVNALNQDMPVSLAEVESKYDSIRSTSLDPSRVMEMDRLSFNKDAMQFEFRDGIIYFVRPVSDRAFAAYFEGDGVFRLHTDDEIERYQIQRFTDADYVEKDFTRALLFFSDSTYERMRDSQTMTDIAIPDSVVSNFTSFRKKIRGRFTWNIDARLLADLLLEDYGDYFSAFIECRDEDEMVFMVDPMDEEEVSLLRYEKIKFSQRAYWETWYSARLEPKSEDHRSRFDIEQTEMEIIIEGNEKLSVNADIQFKNLGNSLRIAPLFLAPVLRVETAVLAGKDTCLVIQEGKNEDAQLWLVFPYYLKKHETYDLTLVYDGKGLIKDIGGDNYSIIGRTTWYPSFYPRGIDPRRFIMTFAVPEKMTLLATGELLRTWTEGDEVHSVWDSKFEHYIAGFNYGKFSVATEKSSLCEITSYTNEKLSDELRRLQRYLEEDNELQAYLMLLPQELTTDHIGRNAAVESRNAYGVFAHFFGEIPIREINVSQQPQTSFAASWPTLIFLPYTAFFDVSIRQRLFEPVIGLRQYATWESYHEGVASHEIAHQWWGHSVMTGSYHDTWLDEGFATYSEGLHLQVTEGVESFKRYMKTLYEQVLSDVGDGVSLSDLGPIWLGERLSSLDIPRGKYLIYAKGAYVLHMLRMMMMDYDSKSDDRFITMMRDYVRTYTGKIVTTDDFRNLVEKHIGMDMGWFFDQWVYGTDIPIYRFDYDVEEKEGYYLLTIYAQQSDVDPAFEMPVPFVVNFRDGHSVVHVNIKGLRAIGKKFRLPQKPTSVVPNPWNAVLCTVVDW